MNVFTSIGRSARLCFFAAITTVALPVAAQVIPQPQTIIPAAPQLAASSWILMDANSGRILAEHNSDERLPPASLTKLMT
ncbi:MAG TPA: serine-type D-Ala-D-Ala carboxypeptidase, partial [Halomonas sp.]|nr:serine-type D-Ala-D-Ala carboxypeptidase [Halomonas sp.]